jgi:hypothetical protein
MGIDRTLINVFRSTAEMAIYNACCLASASVALTFWLIVSATFFPRASKSNERAAMVKITKESLSPSKGFRPFSWEIALFFASQCR